MKRVAPLIISLLLAASPAPAQERRILLTFLGDIMAHTVNYILPDYGLIYKDVADILAGDTLSFANLESPVDPSRPYSSYPCFSIPLEYAEAAVEAGVDVFSLGNNHAFDQGQEGVFQTLRAMEALSARAGRRVHYSGLRGNLKAPFAPAVIEKEGLKIGFLAVTQMVNQPQSWEYVQVVDCESRREREALIRYIQETAPAFDLFILSYHGGKEYAATVEEVREAFFEELLAAGVHIVYGHHPHVLQPYRLVSGEGGGRLILFSTGNFISGMTWGIDPRFPEDPRAGRGDSALFQVTVVAREGGVSVEGVLPILITNVKNERGQLVVERFETLLERDLPFQWARYYTQRYELARGLIHP